MTTELKLTLRQQQCLYWSWEGKTAPWIATKLNVSTKTVNFHLQELYIKLQCTNKIEACRIALYFKLITPNMFK